MGLLEKLGRRTFDTVAKVARHADELLERRAAEKASRNADTAGDTKKPAVAAPTASTEPAACKEPAGAQSAPAASPMAKSALEESIGDESVPAQIFGRMSCPWTQRALRLLEDRGIEHSYTALDEGGGYALAPKLKATTGQRTVPYVYLRGKFVGGYDALDEIDRLGQLDEMVKSAEERATSPKPRVRIQIAPRD